MGDIYNVIYPCNGILFTHKKNETLVCFTTWISSDDIMLTESDTKGYILYDTIYIKYPEQANS